MSEGSIHTDRLSDGEEMGDFTPAQGHTRMLKTMFPRGYWVCKHFWANAVYVAAGSVCPCCGFDDYGAI